MAISKWHVFGLLSLAVLTAAGGCKKEDGNGAAQLKSELDQLKVSLSDTQKKRDEYRASLEQTQKELADLKQSQAVVMGTSTKALQEQIATITKERDQALAELKSSQAMIEDLTDKLAEQTKKAEALEKELDKLEESIGEVTEEVEKLEIPQTPEGGETPAQPQQ